MIANLSCSTEFTFFCLLAVSVLPELTLSSQLFSTATLAPVSQLKHTRLAALGESLLSVGHPLASQQREIGQYQYHHTLLGGTRQGTHFPGRNSLFRGFLQGMPMQGAANSKVGLKEHFNTRVFSKGSPWYTRHQNFRGKGTKKTGRHLH